MRHSSTLIAVLLAGCLLLDSADAFFGGKSKKGDEGSNCRTVYDDVWEERCKTLYSDACRTEFNEQCHTIDERVCQTLDEQECKIVLEEKCKDVSYPKCSISLETRCRNEEQCTTVTDNVCKAVPKSICHTVTDKECQTIEERQCRDVIISEEVGNYVKVDEQVVATTRHVAEEVEHEHERSTFVEQPEEYRRIVDTSEGTAYRVLDDSDFDLRAAPAPAAGKKHGGLFKRSIRGRIEDQRRKIHDRLQSLRDRLTKKTKKEPEPVYEPAPLPARDYVVAPTVRKVKVEQQTRSECKVVPTQRCREIPREQCRQESETVCTQVPKEVCQDVEKCNDFPKKECVTATRQACLKVPERQCSLVPRERCDVVPRRACEQIPREVCTSVPSKACKKETVSRPREVCDQAVRTTIGASGSIGSEGKNH